MSLHSPELYADHEAHVAAFIKRLAKHDISFTKENIASHFPNVDGGLFTHADVYVYTSEWKCFIDVKHRKPEHKNSPNVNITVSAFTAYPVLHKETGVTPFVYSVEDDRIASFEVVREHAELADIGRGPYYRFDSYNFGWDAKTVLFT